MRTSIVLRFFNAVSIKKLKKFPNDQTLQQQFTEQCKSSEGT